jgi:arylsulfatase A-like enzyme
MTPTARERGLRIICLGLVFVATVALGLPATSSQPNIVLMMSDDQGWGDTGYNGHKELKTPHLDRMAEDGITFTRFYSANAMCSPTRGSVYTGRHPYRYGITFAMKGMLEPGEICLTTMLKKVGYTTGHFGKWHMGTLSDRRGVQKRWGAFGKNPKRYYCPPWERDVDVCFVTESKVPTWDPMFDPGGFSRGVDTPLHDPETAKRYGNDYFIGENKIAEENLRGDDSRVVMDRAIPFIQNAVKAGKPFLALVWFHTPHSPVLAGGKYKELYTHLSIEQQHYYGCLSAMDDQIGRLRKELKDLKIEDNTMLWFCSDNGPARQGSPREVGTAKNLSGRKLSLREGGIRVPGLLVWLARFPEARIIDTPCVTTDYMPTILAALQLALPKDRPYDGINILPLIENNAMRPGGIGFINGHSKAWIEHQYKLYTGNGNLWELHDLVTDPAEKRDLSKDLPEVKERLLEEFNAWYPGVMADLRSVESR